MVSGFDDGVICLMDLEKLNGQSLRRPVFQTRSNDDVAQHLDQGVYDQWHEQAYEHSDSIISVEATAAEETEAAPLRIMTASKDGLVYVWRILGESS